VKGRSLVEVDHKGRWLEAYVIDFAGENSCDSAWRVATTDDEKHPVPRFLDAQKQAANS
jgi:hypothetical protein